MRLFATLSVISILLTGCLNTPKLPEKLTLDKTLPTISGIEYISDLDSVGFEWNAIKNPLIAGYIIYRGEPNSKLESVGIVPNRFATHFVDTKDLKPSTQYVYRFSAYTNDGRESEATNNIHVKTKPFPEPVSFIKSVPNLPRMSKIIFRPHPSEQIGSYIIEKRKANNDKWQVAGTLKGRLNAEFFDTDLMDNSEYEYRVIAKTHTGILTAPSAIVISVTKPLPPVVTNLKTTLDLPKKIEIKWDRAPNDQNGSYNLYASNFEKIGFTLSGNFKTSAAVEHINENGAKRYYKVTFVDLDGLESPTQEKAIVGSTQAKPNSPKITRISYNNSAIDLSWDRGDLRNEHYIIKRQSIFGIIKKDPKTFRIETGESYIDSDVKAGVAYQYTIIGIDKNGIESNESESAKITVNSSGVN